MLFDKRSVISSGDPFNFAGPGASATNEPFAGHATYWIGRGNQTTCPAAIVSGAGGHFAATDAWRGRTVLWAKIRAGNQDKRSERWPATPPEVNVEGDWTLVHDPRTGTSSASSNQALIVLDALRNNPIRAYADSYLRLDTFAWAADVAEEPVAVRAGGTIPRYRAGGVLVWVDGSELEDQIEPLLAAGASRLVRIGGRLGIIPACTRPAVHTIRDITDGQPLQLTRWQSGDSVHTECVARYVAPDRAYEGAEAPAWVAPGAQAADDGLVKRLDLQLDFVTDHRQAQRLAKIATLRSRTQRQVSAELFPDAFVLVAGSVCTLDLPAPYSGWNTTYEVESIHPAAGINDDDSVTLRLPVQLRETSAAIYAWTAATEEKDVEGAVFDANIAALAPPASVTLSTGGGAALIPTGGTPVPRVEVSWPVSTGASVLRYEWQYAVEVETEGGGDSGPITGWSGWTEGGMIEADGASVVRVWINPVSIGSRYRARVKAHGSYGSTDWVEAAPIVASGPTRVVGLPSILLATGGAGQIDLTLRQASDAQANALELWSHTTTNSSAATLLRTLPAGANVTVSTSHTGLGAAATRHYWLRARDALGNASAFTGRSSATTT